MAKSPKEVKVNGSYSRIFFFFRGGRIPATTKLLFNAKSWHGTYKVTSTPRGLSYLVALELDQTPANKSFVSVSVSVLAWFMCAIRMCDVCYSRVWCVLDVVCVCVCVCRVTRYIGQFFFILFVTYLFCIFCFVYFIILFLFLLYFALFCIYICLFFYVTCIVMFLFCVTL